MVDTMLERYQSCMLLHGVGDAMGYKNGRWEFKFSGEDIHEELAELGGIEKLKLNPIEWRVSDDTILHLSVAECLIENSNKAPSEPVWLNLIDHYKEGMNDMKDRAPGNTCIISIHHLSKVKPKGYQVPFNFRGGGCGASMRSSCIGLRYSKPEQINDLIVFAVESGRMTHHHPIGYLGAVAAALFTSYAIQDLPVKAWGAKFLTDVNLAKKYISSSDHCTKSNLDNWESVIKPWEKYLQERNIANGTNEPTFPADYGVKQREEFYRSIMNNHFCGSNGIDSVLIAYDGLLGCQGDWKELCLRAMLHGGDNDSTGCLAGSWYGALYGLRGVPENNYNQLEYSQRLKEAGTKLYNIQYKN